MRSERLFILSIGGYDPSAGAGVLSDIKTYDYFHLNGLAVSTCLTGQSHDEVYDVSWFDEEQIFMQLDPILEKYEFDVCKVAVVKDWHFLNKVIDCLLRKEPKMKIVLDPVLISSSGFIFCPVPEMEIRDEVLSKIFLITPNQEEFDFLGLDANAQEHPCHVLLKSVVDEPKGTDFLMNKDGERTLFKNENEGSEKHG